MDKVDQSEPLQTEEGRSKAGMEERNSLTLSIAK